MSRCFQWNLLGKHQAVLDIRLIDTPIQLLGLQNFFCGFGLHICYNSYLWIQLLKLSFHRYFLLCDLSGNLLYGSLLKRLEIHFLIFRPRIFTQADRACWGTFRAFPQASNSHLSKITFSTHDMWQTACDWKISHSAARDSQVSCQEQGA